jgi:hypothetical protein
VEQAVDGGARNAVGVGQLAQALSTSAIAENGFTVHFDGLAADMPAKIRNLMQELLRHANSRITLDVYEQAIMDERRAAQGFAFKGLMERGQSQHPYEPESVAGRRGHAHK